MKSTKGNRQRLNAELWNTKVIEGIEIYYTCFFLSS